jgi:hypothetical protein
LKVGRMDTNASALAGITQFGAVVQRLVSLKRR